MFEEKIMTFFCRGIPWLVFPLLLFFQISRMYPKDPIIRFPMVFLCVLFILVACYVFFDPFSLKRKTVFFPFASLECLIIFFVYEHSLFYSLDSSSFYLSIPLPLFLFVFSYNITIEKDVNFLPIISVFMVSVYSIVFLSNHNTDIYELLSVDSGSYTILYYLPILLCLKNKFLRWGSVLLCFITVLLSFKRGGIICLISGLYVYIMICVITGTNWIQRIKRLCVSIVPLALIVVGLFYINEYYGDLIFNRFSQVQETGGSGRNVIFVHVWEMISSSSWFELLVGHGWNTVLRDNYMGFSAHNDFLECIYDCGVITFIAYLALYINLVRLMLDLLKRNSIYAAPLAASIVMFLTNSLVSHILLYDWHFITFAMFWGYIVACDDKQEKMKQCAYLT